MSRQVDVKALVSHIIKGDGEERCRICMGETSEGQVFLGDTVMMDGTRAVTLAELLVMITGIEVQMDEGLPPGLCPECTSSALAAANFRNFCQESFTQWRQSIYALEKFPTLIELKGLTSVHAAISGEDLFLLEFNGESNYEFPDLTMDYDYDDIPEEKNSSNQSGIMCPDCDKSLPTAAALYSHLKESTEMKRACMKCAKIMSRDNLIEHLTQSHNKVLKICSKCPEIFLSKKKYLAHYAKVHSGGSHGCGECGKNFQSVYALNAHLGVHAIRTCPSCSKVFRNQTCYVYHVKQCCKLDRISHSQTHRTKHKVTVEIENTESNEKVKVGLRGSTGTECYCDYCGKKFRNKKFVSAHIQIIHMKNTHRACPYCGKYFAAARMTEHIKKHSKTELFTCETCGLTLKSKLGYSQHLRLHTGEKPYQCKYCEESFSSSSRRSEHIKKVHTSQEVALKHACNYCTAKFRLPYILKKHLATVHPSEKDENQPEFTCNICWMKFSSCRGLVHHSKMHQRPRSPVYETGHVKI